MTDLDLLHLDLLAHARPLRVHAVALAPNLVELLLRALRAVFAHQLEVDVHLRHLRHAQEHAIQLWRQVVSGGSGGGNE